MQEKTAPEKFPSSKRSLYIIALFGLLVGFALVWHASPPLLLLKVVGSVCGVLAILLAGFWSKVCGKSRALVLAFWASGGFFVGVYVLTLIYSGMGEGK